MASWSFSFLLSIFFFKDVKCQGNLYLGFEKALRLLQEQECFD